MSMIWVAIISSAMGLILGFKLGRPILLAKAEKILADAQSTQAQTFRVQAETSRQQERSERLYTACIHFVGRMEHIARSCGMTRHAQEFLEMRQMLVNGTKQPEAQQPESGKVGCNLT
jgi:hypothetical protein